MLLEEMLLLLLPAQKPVDLIRFRCARCTQTKGKLCASGRFCSAFLLNTPRQRLCSFKECRIVQCRQSLKWRVRAHAPHGAHLTAGRVEVQHAGVRRCPANEGVEAPPVAILT